MNKERTNTLFYIGWNFFVFSIVIRYTAWYSLMDSNGVMILALKCLRYLSYFICVCSFIFREFSRNKLCKIIIVEVLLTIILIESGDKTLLLLSWIFIAAYGIDSRECIKQWLRIQLGIQVCVAFLSQIGLIEDYIFYPELRARHSLGFEWASISPTVFLFCFLSYVYLKKEKVKLNEFFIIEIINIVLFILTDSRMPFILLTIMVLFFGFERMNKKRWKYSYKLKKSFLYLPFICFLLTLFASINYDSNNRIWKGLDLILSGRLRLQKKAYDLYGVSLFGNRIEWIGYSIKTIVNGAAESSYNYVDSSYMQILFSYGIIFLIFTLCIYTNILKKAIGKKEYYTVWIIVFILIMSMTEPRLINLAYNPFPILFSAKLKRSSSVKNEIPVNVLQIQV